ncbi:B12-binding domain-containing radical SAM protein [Clostridium grantii]|uniref:Radical SAM superfamily enzyme YgiQ, UPF0313 family n=1 Tax=Clostridium grantii DSM 8605 TaxID=1121316 RepID=A0A1M5VFV7_9CLOT|nr:radical SAM protein [Clostridium grantii]SHH74055.1 Radical SAM superfamily enzyme YgiQ, UPF0313 family [Clostridium grantii DSM 8605]
MESEKVDLLLILAPSPNPSLNLGFNAQGMPPLGLGYIATYVSQFDYSVKILDLSIPENTIEDVLDMAVRTQSKLIGISTTTETFNSGILIAEKLKENNETQYIFMGGAHVTFKADAALKSGFIDIVIRGEGEIPTKELCDYFIKDKGNLDEIMGISYMSGEEIINNPDSVLIENLDELPFPDRKFFELDKYPHKGNCSTSRGCPGKCIFCAASGLAGGKYRMRSATSIVAEFEYLKSIGCNHIDIVDDTMTASIKRLDELLNILIEKELGVTWYCESRVDVITKELLIKMKKAGLRIIQFGVEAGNQKMLDCLKKNITIGQIENVFNWCKELEIPAITNMILGQPYDTKESIEDTITLAKKIVSFEAYVNFTICTPFPGTYMWDHYEELHIKIVENNLDKYTTFFPVIETKDFTANEIRNIYYKASLEVLKFRQKLGHLNEKGIIRFNEQLLLASNYAHDQFNYYKVNIGRQEL